MNLIASLQARIKNKARQLEIPYASLLEQFALSRFFARLSESKYADEFVLKGAQLFRFWTSGGHRPTRDADFLASKQRTPDELESIFSQIFNSEPKEADALKWGDIRAVTIRNDKSYGGVRITATALLGNVRIPLQFDIGYGDAITPDIVEQRWRSVLDYSETKLLTYPVETVIAEKIEAAVSLEISNSRMKDFFDLLWLSQNQSFSYELLCEAITNTFNRRKTTILDKLPMAYSEEFAKDENKQVQWKAFLRKSSLEIISFEEAIEELQQFIEPLFVKNSNYTTWSPNDHWS